MEDREGKKMREESEKEETKLKLKAVAPRGPSKSVDGKWKMQRF